MLLCKSSVIILGDLRNWAKKGRRKRVDQLTWHFWLSTLPSLPSFRFCQSLLELSNAGGGWFAGGLFPPLLRRAGTANSWQIGISKGDLPTLVRIIETNLFW
jgi:hypothetical protein